MLVFNIKINMKRNVGNTDRLIRIIVAIIAAIVFFIDIVPKTYGYLILAFGGIMLATAFINFCALYAPFGINTCKRKGL